MKKAYPKSIFELIDSENFRKRTGMYLGKNSISNLRIFMDGYQICEMFNEIKAENTTPPFWLFFKWICKYYNHDGSYYSWDGIILQNSENDEAKALSTFFKRFDEFRNLKPKKLITCQITEKEIEYFSVHNKIVRRRIFEEKETIIGPANNLFIVEYDKELGSASYHRKKEQGIIHSKHFETTDKAILEAEKEYGKSLKWKEIPKTDLKMIYE